MSTPGTEHRHGDAPRPTAREAARVWWRLGLLSFGGPSAQIALMHRELVDERGWLDEDTFLRALGFCMLLPGPEAMQLATYAGWRLHGVRGGLHAGLAFVLPGALVVLSLALAYAAFGSVPLVAGAFRGIQATVLVLVVEAVLRTARRTGRTVWHRALALGAFVALQAFAVPFPWVVLAGALVGAVWLGDARPAPARALGRVSLARTLRTAAAWLALWWLPLLGLRLSFGPEYLPWQLGVFFSKLATVTFGGAYAVLSYMAQDVVQHHHWLSARAMVDGLGLAETTPGPLILVTTFVATVASHRAAATEPWAAALLGAGVALWATFVPCFLWIFTGAPWLDAIAERPRLRGALAGITAVVLGVIANLAVWFALHVLFRDVRVWHAGPLRLWWPEPASLEARLLVVTVAAALLVRFRGWGAPATVALGVVAGILLRPR